MVLYISERPENKQGGVRVYNSLSRLISFKSAWRDIALCFGIFPREKGLLRKSLKKVIYLKEMMFQKEFKRDKQHSYA